MSYGYMNVGRKAHVPTCNPLRFGYAKPKFYATETGILPKWLDLAPFHEHRRCGLL